MLPACLVPASFHLFLAGEEAARAGRAAAVLPRTQQEDLEVG